MILELRGHHFDLLPERAAVWKEKNILLCSDVHWGREAFLQKMGVAIPDQSFAHESVILQSLIAKHQIQEWWILGDFIHHPKGMHPELIQKISGWMKNLQLPIKLIPGNHDRALSSWAGELDLQICHQGIEDSGFLFKHEPPRKEKPSDGQLYSWYGHLHPSISLGNLFRTGKLPCFWIREKEAYLPAFSRLAGGAEIDQILPTDQIFVVADDEVVDLRILE